MIILGIDPGLETTGFAVVESKTWQIIDFGVVLTDKKLSLPVRLLEISQEIAQIIRKHQPDLMAIEDLVFVQNVTSGMAVAHARGVILMEAERAGLKIAEIKPKEIKMRCTGYGNAPKIQVQNMVQKIFKLAKIPKPDDAADALAIAYAASEF